MFEEEFNAKREIVRMKEWYRDPPSYMTKEQCGAVEFALIRLKEMIKRAENGEHWQECRMVKENPHTPPPELSLADCIGWENGIPELRVKVRDLLYKLMTDIEAIGDGNPYWSSVYSTPQGNTHTAYANGKVKEQGAAVHPVRCAAFTEEAQYAAFEEVSDALLTLIRDDKPQGRDRLIWRCRPEAARELHEDGLYIKIYTRVGWDKSEENPNG